MMASTFTSFGSNGFVNVAATSIGSVMRVKRPTCSGNLPQVRRRGRWSAVGWMASRSTPVGGLVGDLAGGMHQDQLVVPQQAGRNGQGGELDHG